MPGVDVVMAAEDLDLDESSERRRGKGQGRGTERRGDAGLG